MNISVKKRVFNEKYYEYLEDYEHRINVFYGGAGSGKSHFVVQKIICKCLKFPNRKVLVIRKVANTLRDSIFALFKTVISDWKLDQIVTFKEYYLNIDFPNGSSIIFKGLEDSEKIKSIANIDDIVIEEATEITIEEFNQLNLRLRSRNPYNQIHMMYNPVSKINWVYNQFHTGKINENLVLVVHTTYKDNKFLPNDYKLIIEAYKETDYNYYKIYALGEFASLDKQVYDNWKEESFDIRNLQKSTQLNIVYGLDFGYSIDATAFICIAVDDEHKIIYIFNEMVRKGLTNSDIAEEITKMGYSKEVIIADSSEPKSIEELRRYGLYRVKAARKGRDSVLNGIQFIRQYSIVVHSRCKHTIDELRNYTYSKDRATGEYTNRPIDRNNHAMDAMRYAMERVGTSCKMRVLR